MKKNNTPSRSAPVHRHGQQEKHEGKGCLAPSAQPRRVKRDIRPLPSAADTATAPARSALLCTLAQKQRRITVIGGGASGMLAAIAAAQESRGAAVQPTAESVQVVLLEKAARPGKKLLATGNGRCNISNTRLSAAHYLTSDPHALQTLLQNRPVGGAATLLRQLGLLCSPPEDGRIYPWCEQASAVLDVLRTTLNKLGVVLLCDCPVTTITPRANGFAVTVGSCEKEENTSAPFVFLTDRVILSAGGTAAPALGGCADGFALAQAAGHRCLPLYPALTALRCALPCTDADGRHTDLLPGLKGIRCRAAVALCRGEITATQDIGEIQFGEGTVSGIPVLQLSLHYTADTPSTLVCNLLPTLSPQAVQQLLRGRRTQAGAAPLEDFLIGTVHKKLGYAVMKVAGLSPLSRPAHSLTDAELDGLAHTLQCLVLPIKGTCGWEGAQVTRGGVPLCQVDTDCASLVQPGLYLTGELLDVAGQCGGYNLDWAFCTGFCAGTAAARSLR